MPSRLLDAQRRIIRPNQGSSGEFDSEPIRYAPADKPGIDVGSTPTLNVTDALRVAGVFMRVACVLSLDLDQRYMGAAACREQCSSVQGAVGWQPPVCIKSGIRRRMAVCMSGLLRAAKTSRACFEACKAIH
jgi:hypothetical protein